jgi:hypothetical protein
MHVTADPQIESKPKALNAGAITPHQDEWIFWRVEANGNEGGRGGGALWFDGLRKRKKHYRRHQHEKLQRQLGQQNVDVDHQHLKKQRGSRVRTENDPTYPIQLQRKQKKEHKGRPNAD